MTQADHYRDQSHRARQLAEAAKDLEKFATPLTMQTLGDMSYGDIGRQLSTLADAYDVNVASHNFNGPLANVMSAHFCAVVPNYRIMEFDVDEVPWKSSFGR